MFKLQRMSDKLYSEGGVYPSFHKIGKLWRTKDALVRHLAQVSWNRRALYDDVQVITFELVEVGMEALSDFSAWPQESE